MIGIYTRYKEWYLYNIQMVFAPLDGVFLHRLSTVQVATVLYIIRLFYPGGILIE